MHDHARLPSGASLPESAALQDRVLDMGVDINAENSKGENIVEHAF